MARLRIQAYGKINLALDVLCRRADGYHDVSMVMQSVSVADQIYLESKADGISMTTSNPSLGTGRENLAYRAAALLAEKYDIPQGVAIHLDKKIPVAAGMGGGSADAAGVLVGLNHLWKLNLSLDELAKVAVKLGADVPFCLKGGTALAEGIGEKLTQLPSPEPYWITMLKPAFPVSTAAVYQAWDELEDPPHPDVDAVVKLLKAGEVHRIPEVWGNALETVTFRLRPEVEKLWRRLRDQNLQVRMTGSGPTLFVWGLPGEAEARRLAEECRRLGAWADALTTCDHGISLSEE